MTGYVTDPDTHYQLLRSGSPVSVDGFKLGEPTGEVCCLECGVVALDDLELPHDEWCPQRDAGWRTWHDD